MFFIWAHLKNLGPVLYLQGRVRSEKNIFMLQPGFINSITQKSFAGSHLWLMTSCHSEDGMLLILEHQGCLAAYPEGGPLAWHWGVGKLAFCASEQFPSSFQKPTVAAKQTKNQGRALGILIFSPVFLGFLGAETAHGVGLGVVGWWLQKCCKQGELLIVYHNAGGDFFLHHLFEWNVSVLIAGLLKHQEYHDRVHDWSSEL